MSKLPEVGTTIFTVMSKLANAHGAYNLSQGFPNFPVDEVLTGILESKSRENVHQYMPMPGAPALLAQIGQLIERSYGRCVDAEQEILVTAGATQGLFTSIMAFVDRGDEVIILDPAYDSYAPSVILAGGAPMHVPLNVECLPDWDRIEAAMHARTRMLITNNPHNPSGRIWSAEDLARLEEILLRHPQVLWLSDEVYEFITFDAVHQSAHALPSLHDRTIIASSFGKTFHITGWKIGYLVAPPALMTEIRKVHQFNVFCVNSVAQAVLTEYLSQKDVSQLGAFYKEKRDLFRSLMQDSRFELLPCEGTYFQCARYTAISDMDDLAFCRWLTEEKKVAAIPLSAFYANGKDEHVIRFCFAKDTPTLTEACQLLSRI
jgi:methionine aminotransferase